VCGFRARLGEGHRRGEADGDAALSTGHSCLCDKDLRPGRSDAKTETGKLTVKNDAIAAAGSLGINEGLGKALGHRYPFAVNLEKCKRTAVYFKQAKTIGLGLLQLKARPPDKPVNPLAYAFVGSSPTSPTIIKFRASGDFPFLRQEPL
jgi:hypothetical protein